MVTAHSEPVPRPVMVQEAATSSASTEIVEPVPRPVMEQEAHSEPVPRPVMEQEAAMSSVSTEIVFEISAMDWPTVEVVKNALRQKVEELKIVPVLYEELEELSKEGEDELKSLHCADVTVEIGKSSLGCAVYS